MTDTLQPHISKLRLGAVSTALAVAAVLVLSLVAIQSAHAQTLTVIYNFTGSSDGGDPYDGLLRDTAGNLYGTGDYGGSSYAGVVFKVDTSGAETVLYNFTGGNDGAYPYAGLVRDSAGNFYGTATEGGTSGLGVVFELDTSGKETVLHSFTGGTDGIYPYGGLFRDKAGNLYGTTETGGTSNYGVVFKVSKAGKETVLHTFTGAADDGAVPLYSNFYADAKGYLYSVASQGGTSGEGVLYKLSKTGKLTVLHSFAAGTADGCYPYGTPAVDKKGNFYGTTAGCGTSNLGTVWKVSKKGAETVLHNFAGGTSDGEYPLAGVIIGAKGNLYGDTSTGGASNLGTAYEVNKKGTLTLLHSFTGASDGEFLYGGLIQDAKGNLYSTNINGGSGGYGTVWRLTP
jgi:uncharacterized repeat protein (TIGR03803 family)